MEKCKDCFCLLTETNWVKHSKEKRGYRLKCKQCHKKEVLIYREKIKLAFPDKARKIQRRSRLATYGITLEEYEDLLREQNGLCAICKQKEQRYTLLVDHDHITGKIRGLLCNNCNTALGMVNDSIEKLKNMIIYLKSA